MEEDDFVHVRRALAARRFESDDGKEAADVALIWGPRVTQAAAAELERSARRLVNLAGVCAVAARRFKHQ